MAAIIVGAAIGGTALVKPPTGALVAAAVVLLYWFGAFRSWQILAVILIFSVATVLLAAFGIDGSFRIFAARVESGISSAYILDPHYGFAKSADFLKNIVRMLAVLAGVTSLAIGSSSAIVVLTNRNKPIMLCWYLCMLLLFFVALIALFYGERFAYGNDLRVISFAIAGISLGTVIASLRLAGYASRATLILCVWLAALPLIFAVGTGTNLLLLAGQAQIFSVVMALTVLSRDAIERWRRLLVLEAIAPFFIAITAILIGLSMGHPQRQLVALKDQMSSAKVGTAFVGVDKETSQYLASLNEMRERSGGVKSILDFTGRMPGNAFSLGAIAPGRPWLLSGYPGSEAFLLEALSGVSCDIIAGSWVVADPLSDNAFPISLLSRFGLSAEKHFEVAASLRLPGSERRLIFYRPLPSQLTAVQDCNRAQKQL